MSWVVRNHGKKSSLASIAHLHDGIAKSLIIRYANRQGFCQTAGSYGRQPGRIASIEPNKRQRDWAAGTYNTKQPSNLDMAIDKMQFFSFKASSNTRFARPTSMLMLLSRSYAAHVAGASSFLTNLVNKIFVKSRPEQLELAIAVVDRVPVNTSSSATFKSQFLDPHGSEGISFVIASDGKLNLKTAPKSGGSQDPGTPFVGMTTRAPIDGTSYTFKLPVANTLFQNGQFNTMARTKWIKNDNNHLEAVEYENVGEISITYQPFPPAKKLETELMIPYETLTPIRRIEEGLGNVVKKVSDPNNNKIIMPASAELQMNLNTDEPLKGQIFAAVMPPLVYDSIQSKVSSSEASDNEQLKDDHAYAAKVESAIFFRDLMQHLQQGATIRRVIGGGGEWGDRASLVTLEPGEPFASSNGQGAEEDYMLSYVDRLNSAAIAPAGHYIQFFTAMVNDRQPALPSPLLSIGCVQEDPVIEDLPVHHFQYGRFGGLSSQALGIDYTTLGNTMASKSSHVDVQGTRLHVFPRVRPEIAVQAVTPSAAEGATEFPEPEEIITGEWKPNEFGNGNAFHRLTAHKMERSFEQWMSWRHKSRVNRDAQSKSQNLLRRVPTHSDFPIQSLIRRIDDRSTTQCEPKSAHNGRIPARIRDEAETSDISRRNFEDWRRSRVSLKRRELSDPVFLLDRRGRALAIRRMEVRGEHSDVIGHVQDSNHEGMNNNRKRIAFMLFTYGKMVDNLKREWHETLTIFGKISKRLQNSGSGSLALRDFLDELEADEDVEETRLVSALKQEQFERETLSKVRSVSEELSADRWANSGAHGEGIKFIEQ